MTIHISFVDHSKFPPNYWKILAIIGWLLIFFMLGLCFFYDLEAGEIIDLSIIATIESSNNPLAYNRNSQAIGLFQITPICLNDYNLCHKTCYELIDLLSPKFNYFVAYWYLNKRIPQMLKAKNIPINLDTILWAYNAGVGRVVKGIKPKETRNYIQRYYQLASAK